ncbi:TPA: hypothetical protein N0F65_002725 [Lagenidium giganteum]|uniref:Multicopper oxidase n=1 Tax=Lagenidium giganteum TaxID=4803 RepID=A0AAV2Z3Z6_9STRA|nr:TPA: hypothetical protein N0F65_002725 [Lagenidium giganteum]
MRAHGMKKRAVTGSGPSTGGSTALYGSVFCDLSDGSAAQMEDEVGTCKPAGPNSPAAVRRRRIACSLLCALGLMTLMVVYNGVRRHRDGDGAAQSVRVRGSADIHDLATGLDALVRQLEPLQELPVRRSANGELSTSIHVSAVHFDKGPISFWTRAYEHSTPGPTLCVKPGDVLKINLVNDLEANVPGNWTINTFHRPNTTNLHVHGMHVDPTGIADNVLREVDPGQTSYTEIHIPKNHPRGLFHYHPHFHGSVFLQMGGGMVGALVVEDDASELPDEYYTMVKHVMIFQEFQFSGGPSGNLLKAAKQSRNTLRMQPQYSAGKVLLDNQVRSLFPRIHKAQQAINIGLDRELQELYIDGERPPINPYFTVNGQYMPKIEIQPNENRLLRLLNSAGTNILSLSIPGCTMKQVAADGMYMKEPRDIFPALVLSPGARADVVIRCEGSAEGHNHAVRPIQSIKHAEYADALGRKADVHEGILGFIHVQGRARSDAPVMKCPQPQPSLYADGDLLKLSESETSALVPFDFESTMGDKHEKDGFMYKDYMINHKLFDPTDLIPMKLNQVQEWVIINKQDESGKVTYKNHPFHLHTNAFQVVAMSHGHGVDYQVGDWRDVISVPTPGNVTIRFRPVDFAGVVVAHCHILGHSDSGMVAGVNILPV